MVSFRQYSARMKDVRLPPYTGKVRGGVNHGVLFSVSFIFYSSFGGVIRQGKGTILQEGIVRFWSGRLRLLGKYIDHRLVARPEPDNTFWDDSTTLGGRSSLFKPSIPPKLKRNALRFQKHSFFRPTWRRRGPSKKITLKCFL